MEQDRPQPLNYYFYCFCFRVVRELDAIRQEASLLQDQMASVKKDIQKVMGVDFGITSENGIM